MTDLTPLVPDLLVHARECAPAECCGLAVVIKGRLRYFPCKNIAGGADQFHIRPEDYADAEDLGEIVGICHSHVYVAPQPSEADLVMCEAHGLPWLIVNFPTGNFHQFAPTGYKAPLVGRQYHHGVLDCYQIIKDYYAQELGIEIPHFERQDQWWINGQNLYLEGFEKAGFVQMGDGDYRDIRKHDVLLIQVASPVPNHGAIYLGDGVILQHVANRLSSRDVYGGYWAKHTTHVLRHRSQL